MMPLVLAEIRRVFSADASAVILLNPDQASFTIALADGLLAANTGRRFRAEESLCGESCAPISPLSATTLPARPGVSRRHREEKLGPEMIVPILSESEMLGGLAAQRCQGRPAFSPEEIRLLMAMGEIIGNSLRRARLYDQASNGWSTSRHYAT